MKRIEEYLEIRKGKHKKDWDTVGIIMGDEGVSKSNLLLHIIEHWQKINFGKCVPSDIFRVGLTKELFGEAIAKTKPNGIVGYDEAGGLNSRRALSKFNVALMETYQIIRADRLFTIFVIPNMWDLDKFFKNGRAKFLIYVYARGRFAFWLKEDIKKIIALNENRIIKNPFVVKPKFYDTFPIYKGVLKDKYMELKTQKVKQQRKKIPEYFVNENDNGRSKIMQMVKRMSERGMMNTEIASVMEVAPRTVGRYLQAMKNDK